MNKNVMIEKRFEGPLGSVNGGYISGFVAKHIEDPAEVTLREKIPLDQPLLLRKTERQD